MQKVIWITIAGAPYPLRCSVGAWEKLFEIYQNPEGFAKASQDAATTYTAAVDALAIFMAQGCAYLNIFEKDDPGFPSGGYKALTREELATVLELADYVEISKKVQECIMASRHTEINAKPAKGAKKKEADGATN